MQCSISRLSRPSCSLWNHHCLAAVRNHTAGSQEKQQLLLSRTFSEGQRGTPDVFQRSRRGHFFQDAPQLSNPLIEDPFLRSCLSRMIPPEVTEEVFEDLKRFGERVSTDIDDLGRQAELEPPFMRSYDAWGKRIDELVTSPAWKRMHDISAEEGLIALAYERKHKQWSRLHQVAKLYLFSPSSGLYSCPLAMTDGAARLIEHQKDEYLYNRAHSHLTTRDPTHFWTSGQWMTERKGGSDVANGTDTIAVGPDSDGLYSLFGYKWFSSASDSNMAFTLARLQDDQGKITKGSRGLSLFYLETRDPSGQLNHLEIQRLKNKLGTRQLPTAELLLDGTKAYMSSYMVGEPGRGVAGISPMLTITRLHNSISAVGLMRRMLLLAKDYSTRRTAFGKYLADHCLHMQTLARMEVETRGCVLLTLEVSRLQGLIECGLATSNDQLLHRVLTPIVKLYTAKQAVSIASEGLESFGGQGYIEDTGLPVFLRDAQVLPIWEGTTNILSLDVLRVMQKNGTDVLHCLVNDIKTRLSRTDKLAMADLQSHSEQLSNQIDSIVEFGLRAAQEDPSVLECAARDLAVSIARVYIGALLIEHAVSPVAAMHDSVVAQRWCSQPLPLRSYSDYSQSERNVDTMLVMDGHGLDNRTKAEMKLDN